MENSINNKTVYGDFDYQNNGLTKRQVLERKKKKLINCYKKKDNGYLHILFKNLFTFLNFILFSCGVIIFCLGLYKRLFFLMTIVVNVIINVARDIKLQKILNSLTLIKQKNMATVIRDKQKKNIFFHEIVLNDIIVLIPNSIVPSDSKVIDGFVFVDESFLTGEKKPVLKKKGDLLYAETCIFSGECKAEVIKVGAENYINKLQDEISVFKNSKNNNLFVKIFKISRRILFISFLIASLEFLVMFLKHNFCVANLDAVVSSFLLMISTGVFLLFSVMLIMYSVNIMKKGILVNEMFALENIVAMNVLCLDKTGTITNDNMEYEKSISIAKDIDVKDLENILSCFTYNGNSAINKNNLTLKAFEKKIKNNNLKVEKYVDFESKKKYSMIVFNDFTYVLGASSFVNVINKCETEKQVNNFEKQGFRTLILARSKNTNIEKIAPDDLETIGIILMSETINDNVEETIKYLISQNIKINVISGDGEEYLKYILNKIGLKDFKTVSLFQNDDEQIKSFINNGYNVFARTLPNQKKIIIEELKKNKNIVTMIGDGVNDLMALKIANCSISMPNGHDVTKKISDFVLLNANFNNIIFLINEAKKAFKILQSLYSFLFVKILCMMMISCFYIFMSFFYNKFFLFNINNLMPWEIISCGLSSTIMPFDKTRTNIDIDLNKFISSIFKKAFQAAFLQVLFFLFCFNIHWFFGNFLNYNGFVSLAVLVLSYGSIFVFYLLCLKPLNKFRTCVLLLIFFLVSLAFGIDATLFYKKNFSLFDLCYSDLYFSNIIVTVFGCVFIAFAYYFINKKIYKINHKK